MLFSFLSFLFFFLKQEQKQNKETVPCDVGLYLRVGFYLCLQVVTNYLKSWKLLFRGSVLYWSSLFISA